METKMTEIEERRFKMLRYVYGQNARYDMGTLHHCL